MKNLEIEYKKQIADEVPDLWSRIESSIDAIESQNENDNNVVEFKKPEDSIKSSGKKIKKLNSILRYSVIVASAACVLVVVLAVSRSGSNMSATTPMSDSAGYSAEAATAVYSDEAVEEAADETEYKDSAKNKKDKKTSLRGENAAAAAAEAPEMTDSSAFMAEAAEADDFEPEMDAAAEATYEADEAKIGITNDISGSSQSSGTETEGMSNTENITVSGSITDSETVEYKGKEIYFITVTDTDGNEYRAFVPEEKAEEVKTIEKEGKELTFILSESTGGYYDAEYVYESTEK